MCAKDSNEKSVLPVWLNDPGGHQYSTSYNLPPSKYSPVLISSKQRHISDLKIEQDQQEALVTCPLAIQPMLWGLIPSWHQGDSSSFNYKMNNARSDSLLSKASYKKPLQAGQRCVILADGYYEWYTRKDNKKQPYFLYFSENSEVYKSLASKNISGGESNPKAENIESDAIKCEHDKDDSHVIKQEDHKEYSESTKSVVIPKKLLTMAGVFDVWKSRDTDEIIYSYAVITVDANKDYEFIHDRMPAILKDEEEVDRWLNCEDVPLEEALKLIRPTNSLACHPVSCSVNNSRQNSPDCILPIDLDKPDTKNTKLTKSGSFMMSWLGKKRTADNDSESVASPKKSKIG